MRRLALIATLLAAGAAYLTASAGAEDTHTYTIELDNAFGIVQGSEVRVAGVNQGEITAIDVNAAKRALLTAELSGPLAQLGRDTECSSEPQSLIAEYFIDCQSQGEPIPPEEEGSTAEPNIPVAQTTQTVQADLVQNTLREPFKRRLQLLIAEFGTALAGNPQNLNAAIRRGAPALRELEAVLEILGDQNRVIRDLNANSDRIMARLAARRNDVVEFVQEARDTARASAERRADLATNFNLLDDFLAELRPTLFELGRLARAQTPLLSDLRAAAPGLNTLAQRLPAFNASSEVSLESLGGAAVVGKRALKRGRDEIAQLRRTAQNAPAVAEMLADFLVDLDDPRRAVEIDERAGTDTGRKGTEPGTPNTMGYTGLEGLLNYVYYQTGALNQFDQVGHLLHISLYEVGENPCSSYDTGGRDREVPAEGGGTTSDPGEIARCVIWFGPNQPDINEPLGLPPYDPAACPEGTDAPELCDPNGPSAASRSGGSPEAESLPGTVGPGEQAPEPGAPTPGLPGIEGPGGGGPDLNDLEDLLDLPGASGQGLPGTEGIGANSGSGEQAAEDLLDFLFRN